MRAVTVLLTKNLACKSKCGQEHNQLDMLEPPKGTVEISLKHPLDSAQRFGVEMRIGELCIESTEGWK